MISGIHHFKPGKQATQQDQIPVGVALTKNMFIVCSTELLEKELIPNNFCSTEFDLHSET